MLLVEELLLLAFNFIEEFRFYSRNVELVQEILSLLNKCKL